MKPEKHNLYIVENTNRDYARFLCEDRLFYLDSDIEEATLFPNKAIAEYELNRAIVYWKSRGQANDKLNFIITPVTLTLEK